MNDIKINNSKEASIKSGKWKNPGSKLFNELKGNKSLLKEAYLVIGDINDDTNYSNSGCKYPHHEIKNGELVVSIPGVKAAYSRSCQMNLYNGEIKKHLDKHFKELDMLTSNGVKYESVDDAIIEDNFLYIESVIDDVMGTKLVDNETFIREKLSV